MRWTFGKIRIAAMAGRSDEVWKLHACNAGRRQLPSLYERSAPAPAWPHVGSTTAQQQHRRSSTGAAAQAQQFICTCMAACSRVATE